MKAREVIKVPLDDLEPDPAQVRREFPKDTLEGLAQSLRETGQQQPILANRKGDKLIILDGERRWRAAKLAGLGTVEVLIVDESVKEGSRLQLQLTANLQREDLSPVEKARAIRALMQETGWTAARVAISLGLSAASVSRTIALLSLPDEVQARIASGDLTASAGYQLARSAADVAVSATRSVAKEVQTDQEDTPVAKPRATRHVAHLSLGRQVVLKGAELRTLDDLVNWVEDLLAKARRLRSKGMQLPTFLAQLKLDAKHAASAGKDDVGEGEVRPC